MKRYGMITGLHADKVDDYKTLHAAVWPDILAKISACNLRNYSIYHRQIPNCQNLLFSYFEYTGTDFAADMQMMADDPRTQEWWALCNPCQQPLEDNALGGAWVGMEEVFHLD